MDKVPDDYETLTVTRKKNRNIVMILQMADEVKETVRDRADKNKGPDRGRSK